jgi:hypothetical protein
VRHSGGAIARAFARVVESNRSGHSYAPEGSAPRVVLNRLLDRIFAELRALVHEAKILKLRSPCTAFSTGLRMNPMIVALGKAVGPIPTPRLAIPASLH